VPTSVEFHANYDSQLDAALDFMLGISTDFARRFATAHDAAIAQIRDFPESGQKQDVRFRSVRVHGSDFRIVYEVLEGRVVAMSLTNGRRRGR
jgi:plasmid stabilization system protein ParE